VKVLLGVHRPASLAHRGRSDGGGVIDLHGPRFTVFRLVSGIVRAVEWTAPAAGNTISNRRRGIPERPLDEDLVLVHRKHARAATMPVAACPAAA